MEHLEHLEIISFSTINGKLFALVSYQDTSIEDDDNNGYRTIEMPVNIREVQTSIRGNMLVNQSIKQGTHSATYKKRTKNTRNK